MRDFERPKGQRICQPTAEILEEKLAMSSTVATAWAYTGDLDIENFAQYMQTQDNTTAVNHVYGVALIGHYEDEAVWWEEVAVTDEGYDADSHLMAFVGPLPQRGTDPMFSTRPVNTETVNDATINGVSARPVNVDGMSPTSVRDSIIATESTIRLDCSCDGVVFWINKTQLDIIAETPIGID